MNGSSLSNIYLEPLVPLYLITFILLLFGLISFFSVLTKSPGIIYRLGVLFILILIILRPGYKIEKIKSENDIVTIIVDKTKSQKIANRTEKLDLVRKNILEDLSTLKNLDILEITIDEENIKKNYGTPEEILSNKNERTFIKNSSNKTNIIKNLSNSINLYPPQRLSSVLILSDGQIHDLDNNYEKINVPIYYLLIGDKKINDIKLTMISHPEFGYLDEKINIKLKAEDFSTNEANILNLLVQNGADEKLKYKIKNNTIKEIKLELKNPGSNFIRLSLENRINELSSQNNSAIINISGVRKKLRVLLISGAPYMGTRVWRNFLKSDPSVELVHMTVLRPPEKNDNTPLKELSLIPFPIKELFEEKLKNFQLVIFDNFKGKKVLTPFYFQNLLNFINNGGAILEITGPSYNSKSSLFRTEIGQILPGVPSGKILFKDFKPQHTDLGKKHPITKSLFENTEKIGSWFQMNQMLEIDDNSLILLSGINDEALLAIKKVNKGRVAQIYSNDIWLWTKSENETGGPYNKLIKNLAHWLMKEPSLEENKLKLNVQNENIVIEKLFLIKPENEDLKITIIGPYGKRYNETLVKSKNNTYKTIFKFPTHGFYLISDKNIEKGISTKKIKDLELQNIHLTEDIIKKNNISNIFSKVVWLNNKKLPEFREIDDINKKLKNDNLFYIHRNNNTIVEGLERKRLLNPIILIITLIILFYLCWKKETK